MEGTISFNDALNTFLVTVERRLTCGKTLRQLEQKRKMFMQITKTLEKVTRDINHIQPHIQHKISSK